MSSNNNGWVFNADKPDVIVKEADNGQFTLTIATDNGGVNVNLSLTALQSLVRQCEPYLSDGTPTVKFETSADLFREPALVLKHLDDRSIQCLLRETQSQTLVDFLWYMKDDELIKQILDNCSKRAAALMMDDLECDWQDKDPDNIPQAYARRGRDAVTEVMDVYYKLVKSGDILDLF